MWKHKKGVKMKALGVVRSWIQRNALNGSSVTWGSSEELKFNRNVSPKMLEELAKEIHEAYEEKPILFRKGDKGNHKLYGDIEITHVNEITISFIDQNNFSRTEFKSQFLPNFVYRKNIEQC